MEYALLQKDRVVLAPSYLSGLDSRKKPQITTIFNMAVLFFLTLRHSRLLSEFICREVNILISVRTERPGCLEIKTGIPTHRNRHMRSIDSKIKMDFQRKAGQVVLIDIFESGNSSPLVFLRNMKNWGHIIGRH